ncbi:unnamed protein product [Rotaria sp. Silwood1]|nr:unnamed protein product [Rotaria sp. Silwood1]
MAYSSVLSKEECISKIVRLLKLNEEYEPKQIAEELITEGRQVLRDYEQVLDSSVFKSLMDDNQSELLRILKLYHEQRWKETIKEDELHQFLQQVQSTSIVHYNRVLMRTAEYGSKFSKYVDPKLSLAIQLVFKVDNNTMNSDDTFFIQIWDTMLSQGLQDIIDDESQTPINQIENKLIKRFTNLINQNESIKIHRFKPITRSSLDTIEKFNYLNKDLLCMTATNDRSQLDIRDIIDKRKPIVNENKAFKEVIARVIQEMQIIGDQKIERVVHSVNSLINDINNKLSLFWLSLSRSMKSAMHCCAAILIAKCHLDQTENYLSEVLNELKNRKDHLKTYFNAMIDIGSVNDEKAAIDLSKDFEEYLVRSLNVASESIRNEKLISYESLNRKTIKDQCDEKLFRSEDIQWCLKYIADPIKVIEEFFNNIWNAIPHEINHKCTNRKYHYIDLVEDLFCHIKSKKHI